MQKFRGRSEFTGSLDAPLLVDTEDIALDAIEGTLIADDAVDTEHIAADAVTNAKLAPAAVKCLKFQYDFADLGGAQAAIALTDDADAAQTIPDNAVITEAYLEAVTSLASSGAATGKLGITGDDDCFITATAFDNAVYVAAACTELTAGIPIRTTDAVSVLLTIAGAVLTTSGKFNVWVKYFEGD